MIIRTKSFCPAGLAIILLCAASPVFAATETVVHTFGPSGSGDSGFPIDPMVRDSSGNLYGTGDGGAHGSGAIFKVTPSGSYSIIYSFCAVAPSCADGSFPGPLLYAPDGNLYGTTAGGGPGDDGVVFRMTTSGALTVLYSFGTARRGAGFNAQGLALGLDGNFYGVTESGGVHSEGMIYQLTPSGQFTELFSFAALSRQFTNATGALPECPLVLGPDGNFYGTTNLGGTQGLGVIFKITPSGRFTVLKDFTNSTGGNPYAPLVVGPEHLLTRNQMIE